MQLRVPQQFSVRHFSHTEVLAGTTGSSLCLMTLRVFLSLQFSVLSPNVEHWSFTKINLSSLTFFSLNSRPPHFMCYLHALRLYITFTSLLSLANLSLSPMNLDLCFCLFIPVWVFNKGGLCDGEFGCMHWSLLSWTVGMWVNQWLLLSFNLPIAKNLVLKTGLPVPLHHWSLISWNLCNPSAINHDCSGGVSGCNALSSL